MYIGKTPTVGNFQVCDAISVVNGQAAYTLQVGGTNVAPESANHMLVSLNGILQKPGSSFTISGSTMTFASNLATGDVIDFIQILGSVLDLGVPSDGTVSTAKIVDANVTSAKMFSGFKNGITEADQFRLTANKTDASDITANLERNDNNFSVIGSGMSESSGIFTFPQTGIYLITAQGRWISNGSASLYMGIKMQMTTNNSSYANVSLAYESASTNAYANTYINAIVDITNTSTHKVKFNRDAAGTQSQLQGDTTSNTTAFTFIRLGDT